MSEEKKEAKSKFVSDKILETLPITGKLPKGFKPLMTLQEKHKDVIDLIVTGMPKARAYKKVYSTCNNNNTAYLQVSRIFLNQEAQIYYNEKKMMRKQYIDDSNAFTIDDIAGLNKDVISRAERIAKEAHLKEDYATELKALTLMVNVSDTASKQLGLGSHDPRSREKALLGISEAKKQKKMDEENIKKAVEEMEERNRIAKLSAGKHDELNEIIETTYVDCVDDPEFTFKDKD